MSSLLMRMPIFNRLFASKEDSRSAARDRLKSALVGDRQTVAPELMSCLRRDVEECVARYLRADKDASVYKISDKNGRMTLSVEVPVLHILRQATLPQETLKPKHKEESIELKIGKTKLRHGRGKPNSASAQKTAI